MAPVVGGVDERGLPAVLSSETRLAYGKVRSPRTPLGTRVRRGLVRALDRLTGRFGYKVVKAAKHESLLHELDGVYRATVFNDDLRADPGRLAMLADLYGTTASEALYITAHLAKALKVEGDVCEFGVAQGSLSAVLANELFDQERTLWLFDSFRGLPKPRSEDKLLDDVLQLGSIEAYEGKMAYGAAEVLSRLDRVGFPSNRVCLVPGFLEEVVQDEATALPERVCFAYLDLDFYSGTKTALELLDSRLQRGGYMVVDDYGFFTEGAKRAVDEFIDRRQDDYTLSMPIPEAGRFCIIERIG